MTVQEIVSKDFVRAAVEDYRGMCVLDREGRPFKRYMPGFMAALREDAVMFHPGRICGAWP